MVIGGQKIWLLYWAELVLAAWLQRMVAYSTAQKPMKRSTYKSWMVYEFGHTWKGVTGYDKSLPWDVWNKMEFGWPPSHV